MVIFVDLMVVVERGLVVEVCLVVVAVVESGSGVIMVIVVDLVVVALVEAGSGVILVIVVDLVVEAPDVWLSHKILTFSAVVPFLEVVLVVIPRSGRQK